MSCKSPRANVATAGPLRFPPEDIEWKSTGALGIKRVEGEVIVIGTLQPFGKPEIGNRQFLVRNEFLSVEPAMRGWVNAVANYSKPGRHRRSHAVFRSGNDHRFTPSRLC
jgi:hypothetical protein